ncbi:MAG: hypothetical protein ABII27_09060 [bacterium]
MPDINALAKYKELFEFSKYVYNEEIERFRKLDEKASRYFSVYSILIGMFGLLTKLIIGNHNPVKLLDWASLVFFMISAIFLILSWWYAFKVLKVHELEKIAISDDMIIFYDSNNLIDIHYALSKRMKEAYQKNNKNNNDKSHLLYKNYCNIKLFFLFLVIAFIFIGLNVYNNNKIKEDVLWKTQKTAIVQDQDEMRINPQELQDKTKEQIQMPKKR